MYFYEKYYYISFFILKKVLDKVNRNKRIQTNQSYKSPIYKTLIYKQKIDSTDECQSSSLEQRTACKT